MAKVVHFYFINQKVKPMTGWHYWQDLVQDILDLNFWIFWRRISKMPFLTCTFIIPRICKYQNHRFFRICPTRNIKKHWKLGNQIICSISIIKWSTHILFKHSFILLKFVALLIHVRHCGRPNASVPPPPSEDPCSILARHLPSLLT